MKTQKTTNNLQSELKRLREIEMFNQEIDRLIFRDLGPIDNTDLVSRFYDEAIKSIEDGRYDNLKEASEQIKQAYQIFVLHYINEFFETPNLWSQVKNDKTYFNQIKRMKKLEEIEKKNKSIFD